MDMSKYKALFVEQSREHLAELSRALVTLDTAEDTAPIIDEVFRHAHSLKGMAGSMQFNSIVEVAHRMEDFLGAAREGKFALDPEAVDLLLRGVDVISGQVDAVASDKTPASNSDIVEAFDVALRSRAEAPAEPETPAPAPAAAKPRVTAKKRKGSAPRSLRVILDPACKAAAVRFFLVHRKLSEMGKVLESEPSVDAMRRGQVTSLEAVFLYDGAEGEDTLSEALLAVPEVASVLFEDPQPEPEQRAKKSGKKGKAPAQAQAQAQAAKSEPAKSMTTVRVSTDTLDTLIDNVGELFILRERLQTLLAGMPVPEVRSALDLLSTRIREIHNHVLTVRMMPMRTLTDRYPRVVRDLARSLEKEVELEVQGNDIELDRAILDGLDEPLVHTLRNALDHGIEAPAEREKAGKPRQGKVMLSAMRDRDTVVVVVEDDGRGLDPDGLRERAVKRGMVSAAQAEQLSAREAYFLICMPGFSTKLEVTGVSGRGVGMDVVRDKIETLGGTLDIESELGKRTAFILRLPLTLAIVNVLLVEAGRRLFALPVAKVVAVRETGENTIRESGGSIYLSFRHALVPAFNLADLLGLKATARDDHAVVIEDGRDLVALTVDRVIGCHEVVVKPLGDPLDRMEWFSGAAIVGDGKPILILDLPKALRARWAA